MARDAMDMFRYLAAIARKEGATIIIPKNGTVKGLPENLKSVPVEVYTPEGISNRRWAERGESGHWMLMWLPE
jgi:hypothetical protein